MEHQVLFAGVIGTTPGVPAGSLPCDVFDPYTYNLPQLTVSTCYLGLYPNPYRNHDSVLGITVNGKMGPVPSNSTAVDRHSDEDSYSPNSCNT